MLPHKLQRHALVIEKSHPESSTLLCFDMLESSKDLLSRRQPDLAAVVTRQSQSQPFCPRVGIPRLDLVECLNQPDCGVTSLGESKLLSDADSRATIERQILPRRP